MLISNKLHQFHNFAITKNKTEHRLDFYRLHSVIFFTYIETLKWNFRIVVDKVNKCTVLRNKPLIKRIFKRKNT